MSKKEMLIAHFYSTTPSEVFEAYINRKPNEMESLLIHWVNSNYLLPIPVVNVLISYVLLKTNGEFPKPYIEKIASHWFKANINTVEQAIDECKKNHNHISRNNEKAKSI